ncbi:MAG: sigma factor-like helix-turn-helix DNA-binding protein [Nocardioides sp.]
MRVGRKSGSTDLEDAFARYVEEKQGHLMRLAFLLTAHRPTAHRVTREALSALRKSWAASRHRSDLDLYVRGLILDKLPRTPTKPARRGRATRSRGVVRANALRDPASAAVWGAVQILPQPERAVTVLRYFDNQPVTAVSRLLKVSRTRTVELENAARSAVAASLMIRAEEADGWDSAGEATPRWSAIQSLPEQQRDIIMLRCFDRLTVAEIARRLDLDVNTVAEQESAARSTLQNSVAPTPAQPSARYER